MHRLASITSTGLGTVVYGYDAYGKLETITRGTTVYTIEYDSTWKLQTKTKVGSVALSENEYDTYKRLWKVTYANGFSARYEYDNLDRVTKIYQTENNTEELTYEMIYNGEGDLYEIRNYRTNRASFFDYDHAGRCMASKEREMLVDNNTGELLGYGAELSAYKYQYDACNNLTKLTCSVLGSRWSTVYTYDGDNRASTTTLQSGKVIENTFDPLGRVQRRTIRQGNTTIHETAIGYLDVSSSKTTGLVATYQNGSDAAYGYTYDAVGNITAITQGNTSITYEYDAANRLIRENNGVTNQTIVYDYTNDLWGNIQSKTVYPYTTAVNPGTPASTITYAYGNNTWKDQLTSYNGQTFTYDSMGNPLTYRSNYTFTWRGKQMMSASNGTNTLTFEYNEDGLRQKKTVNDVDTNYFYNGSVMIGMQRGQTKYLFSYDAGGNVVSVNWNGDEYFYLRNAQGDIVKLIDASGAVVVEYTYDTWGKKVTTTGALAGTLGLIQPFRYRGYVYDWETGFYYLQSRYYDPTTGRFISADVLLSTGQGVLGHNAFAYCGDNPVGRIDSEGQFWNIIIGAAIGAVVGAVSTIVDSAVKGEEINWGKVAISAGIGAATGALAGATLGAGLAVATGGYAAAQAAGTVTASAVGQVALGAGIATLGGGAAGAANELLTETLVEGDSININKVVASAIGGAVSNLIGFGISLPGINTSNLAQNAKGISRVIKTMVNAFRNSTVSDVVINVWTSSTIPTPLGFITQNSYGGTTMSSKKKKAKPDVSLLAYFWGSIIGFGGCAILFGYFAFSQKIWSLLFLSAPCLLAMIVLLFYNKIFVDHPAEITEIGVKIGKKVTRWEDIEQVWPETIWTGRGEPHMFACFLIKEVARTKKKPKNVRFDFRIPVNDENMKLLEQYMEVSEGRIS